MKKFLSTLLVVTLLGSMMFVLTGCFGKDNEEDVKPNVSQENKDNENKNNDDDSNQEDNNDGNVTVVETEDGNVEVKSTDDAIIMKDETGTTMTLLFDENDKVKSLSMSAEVETDEEAEFLKQLYSTEEFAEMCTVKVEGKVVTIEYTEEYVTLMFGEETRATIEAELATESVE